MYANPLLDKENRSKVEKSEKKIVRQKMINLHLLKRLVIVSFSFLLQIEMKEK